MKTLFSGTKALFFLSSILLLCLVNCAKKGTITGGPKDEDPPQFVKALPPNFSTNFKAKEIRIYFDEYIKLKESQKQILISPPMDPAPIITPLGTASKYIKIKFVDTLLENTTYSINFGESVVDNNEENPYPFFKYVFSTGPQLDSLKLKGFINDSYFRETDQFVSVMLYEIDSTYTDSMIFKEVPRYITSTLDSTEFSIENIKEGSYKLIAIKDKASNFTFQPQQDKIGFYDSIIVLPEDSTKRYKINLFKEVLDLDFKKPKQVSKYHLLFGYDGFADSTTISMLSAKPEEFRQRVLKDPKTDTLHYWFKPFMEVDSLVFEVANKNGFRDTLVSRFKDQKEDSLVLESETSGSIIIDEDFVLTANIPLVKLTDSLITIQDKDSLEVPFTPQLDTIKNSLRLNFKKTEENQYDIKLLPNALIDFYDHDTDTLEYSVRTQKYSDYGELFLTLENVQNYPVIVQMTNEGNEVVAEKTLQEEGVITFPNLIPNTYFLRVVDDRNANGKWDSGNFLQGTQPEKVSHFPEGIEIRANWEPKLNFILE